MSRVINGDALTELRKLPDESVDMCVTSPPYYGLRDYGTGKWVGGDPNCPHKRLSKYSDRITTGHKQKDLIGMVGDAIYKKVCPLCGAVREDNQIGLEETPDIYIYILTQVFHEVRRVLKPQGTLWLNIGDSYWGSGSRGYDFTDKWTDASEIQSGSKGTEDLSALPRLVGRKDGYKNKDLIGIPWMLAFALRNDGWYLRQDIIWQKPNPMPESVTDRCTKSHEYIFLFSKSQKYYFDHEAIQEEAKWSEDRRKDDGRVEYDGKRAAGQDPHAQQSFVKIVERRNKRDVWSVPVQPIREAHFATFPKKLIEPCILAGCPVGGTVLDPFFGSGTTGVVATELNRDYIGIELNPKYVEIINKRTSNIQLSLTGMVEGL